MTDVEFVHEITRVPKRKKLWDKLNKEERRQLMVETEKDLWHIEEVMQDLLDRQEGE